MINSKIYTNVSYYDENMQLINSTMYTENETVYVKKPLQINQLKFLEKRNKLQEFTSSLGGFVHISYVNDELLFNKTNLKVADICRLIYLSTYLGHHIRTNNMLVNYINARKITPMSKDDMQKKLNLKDRAFSNFIREVKKENILIEEEGKYYLSEVYFKKGEYKKLENEGYSRVFINTTRFLYENCKPTQHKILGYIFRLIPYIHYESNRICFNPSCEEFENVKEMNLKDICKLLGVSSEDGNRTKLKKKLLSFSIKYKGENCCLLAYNTITINNNTKEYFSVNPFVIYKGNDMNSIKKLLKSDFSKEFDII